MTNLDESKISLKIDSVEIVAKIYRGTKTFKILYEMPFNISIIVFDPPYFAIDLFNKRLEIERQSNKWTMDDQNQNYVYINFNKAKQFFNEIEKIKFKFKKIKPKLLDLEEKIIQSKLELKTYKSSQKSLFLKGELSQQDFQRNLKCLNIKISKAQSELFFAQSDFIRNNVPNHNIFLASEIIQLIDF
ncbi:hypothetical protein [Polynucleobacter rarus]|uniref:hypothetical protein n=1 Tax=Polynucleobacter rarus TaxID=556055 RepID=UPI000D3E4CBE|nr:hypothetical protein [Polynucleobacter rarus]